MPLTRGLVLISGIVSGILGLAALTDYVLHPIYRIVMCDGDVCTTVRTNMLQGGPATSLPNALLVLGLPSLLVLGGALWHAKRGTLRALLPMGFGAALLGLLAGLFWLFGRVPFLPLLVGAFAFAIIAMGGVLVTPFLGQRAVEG